MELFEEAMRRGVSAAQRNREALERLLAAAQREETGASVFPGEVAKAAAAAPQGSVSFGPERISERFERDARRYPRPLDYDWRDGR